MGGARILPTEEQAETSDGLRFLNNAAFLRHFAKFP